MKIAFMHYHLKPGGVATVLRRQVEALADDCRVLVLTGEQPKNDFPADLNVIPGLGYDGTFNRCIQAEQVSEAVIRAIRSKWPGGCDVLHVHNPLLAKNSLFLKVLKRLQKNGITLFLQVHDLAEDGRPQVYFKEDYVPDCHYGVINSRDFNILRRAGLSEKGLHKTVNAITPLPEKKPPPSCKRPFVLYPVRALRRKNIGEAVLFSLFFSPSQSLCITLPPNSPADQASYEDWKTYAAQNHLDVGFEAGLKEPFENLVAASTVMISTSISEGFGFSFLEPWTAGKMVQGRNLPDITRDFETNGVKLGHLYNSFWVPVHWIGKERLLDRWTACFAATLRKFDTPLDGMNRETTGGGMETHIASGVVDFGLLDEPFQKTIISRVLNDKTAGDVLKRLNPFLVQTDAPSETARLIETNRTAVIRNYSSAKARDNLMTIYARVMGQPVVHRIDKRGLLSQFLNPRQFSLLKWHEYGK